MQPSVRIAKSIVSVLKNYHWERVVILVGEAKQFIHIKDAFEVRLLEKASTFKS